jgi:integrase
VAGVYKRESDKARGKRGKWTAWWINHEGKRVCKAHGTDKAAAQAFANQMEAQSKNESYGMADPRERVWKEHARKPIADHIEDYTNHLASGGDTPKHVKHTKGVLTRLLKTAGITSVGAIDPVKLQAAIGRWVDAEKSARTVNHALGAVKAFARWLYEANRIKEVPRGLQSIARRNEEADRRLVRKVLSIDDMHRLCEHTEHHGEPIYIYGPTRSRTKKIMIEGSERATIYRIAMATGFRANEIRQLTCRCFDLGEHPTISLPASATKNGRSVCQPVSHQMAKAIAEYVEGPDDELAVRVPEKTAEMLAKDLRAAGIDPGDPKTGVIDFHALRASYLTHLARSGVDPKTLQTLARHSSPALTIGKYVKTDETRLREAVEGDDQQ